MSTALVLADDARRAEGCWKRGPVLGNPDSGITAERKTWQNNLNQAGTILDHAPDLAEQVIASGLAPPNPFSPPEKGATRHPA